MYFYSLCYLLSLSLLPPLFPPLFPPLLFHLQLLNSQSRFVRYDMVTEIVSLFVNYCFSCGSWAFSM